MGTLLVNKYFDRLVKELNKSNDYLELEIRFRGYDKQVDGFTVFNRVNKYLTNLYGPRDSIRTEDYIKNSKYGNERFTIVNTEFKPTYKKIIKKNIWNGKDFIDDDDFEFKISLASEIDEDVSGIPEDIDVKRIKTRQTWDVERKHVRYDITKVEQTENNETKDEYEVEMEMIHPLLERRNLPLSNSDMEELKKALFMLSEEIFRIRNIITDTEVPYKKSDKIQVARFINNALNIDNQFTRLPEDRMADFAVKARNIQFRDIVYGGLLSKNISYPMKDKITKDPTRVGYSVTIKADGVRKFLVIHNTGIWLVYNKEFNRLATLPESWSSYVNTILDGEDIDKTKRTSYLDFPHYYLPFDTLVFKGKNVCKETLEKRLSYTKFIRSLGVLTFNRRNMMVMEEKPFIFFDEEPESFYKAMNSINGVKPSYETDGFMFTPNRCEYNPGSDKLDKRLRVLTKNPDICKWKPVEMLTIDLMYCMTPEGRFLCYSRGKQSIKFTGTKENPFDPETQVVWNDVMFMKGMPLGSIIEFEPIKNYDGVIMLKPKRHREDKEFANGKDTVESVWDDIHNPISIDTLLGKNMVLVRKYHNQIKKELFSRDVPDGCHLIDIGSGKGGDIPKMSKFDRILCIEPYDKNLNELKDRLDNLSSYSRMKDKVYTLQSGGEETNKIINEVNKVFGDELGTKPLYISMMLSLSFFWKDSEMLESLAMTINAIRELYKQNGGKTPVKFIFLTIEGKRTYNLLKKYKFNIIKPGYRMSYNEEIGNVSIHIEDSIVENQTEYLVELEDLQKMISSEIDYLKDTYNPRLLLSKDENEFNSMYVYGSYILN